jgi:hypothetical protein
MDEHESKILAEDIRDALKPALIAVIASVMYEHAVDRAASEPSAEVKPLIEYFQLARDRLEIAGKV